MKRPIRTAIAVVLAAIFAGAGAPASVDAEAPDAPGIYGADPELTAVIAALIDRFNNAGLTLPEVRFYVHTTKAGCNGHVGLFKRFDEQDRIDLCITSGLDYPILHELAHAWAHHNLADHTRQAFLDQSGLVWNDPDVEWDERGTEVAANIVAWGLYDNPLLAEEAVRHTERLIHFELLTGIPSPRLQPASGP